jgi:kynurenine formamidase
MTGTKKNYYQVLDDLLGKAEIIDLSYTMEPGMPAWPTQARYASVIYAAHEYGDGNLHSMIVFSEHTGTHIDAPRHFVAGACPIDELPIKTVMGRGVHIDALGKENRSLLGLDAVRAFEKNHGEILKGDIVLFRFGWDEKYHIHPHAAEFLKEWPGLSKEAALYLAEKGVKAVGCDCLSLDPYESQDNPVHHLLLGRGIPILENVCNLSRLPAFSYIIGLPNKFKGGSGSPIRLIALTDVP